LADDLLSPLDLAFWNLDSPGHPMYLGAMAVFETDAQFDADRIASLVAERAAAVPRLRLRVREVWYGAGGAAWVPDETFDVTRHVRVVRRADTTAAVAELMARPMDRARPLWQAYVIDGMDDVSFSVLVKLHHALADGLRAVEIGAALLDQGARKPAPAPQEGNAGRRGLLPFGVPLPSIPDPRRLVTGIPAAVRQAGQAFGIGAAVVRAATLEGRGPESLAAPSSGTRRLATAVLDLDVVHLVRKTCGGTVNDVVMAVLTGAMRKWLQDRGDDSQGPVPRALIPVACRRRKGTGVGNRLSGYVLRLPVAEADPLTRVRRVREDMERNKAAGPDKGPGAVALLADSFPSFAHRIGGPLLGRTARLLFDILVTNVPMLDIPLTLAGCRLSQLYPIPPLAGGQSLAVAVSTYRRRVHIGLFADGEAVHDLEKLSAGLYDALAELTDACARQ
jgi:WS/DGAT/MGAT family acyltransferase